MRQDARIWVDVEAASRAARRLVAGCMPEVLRIRGCRFFFFSREGTEPHPIHVEQAERYAKFWLTPVALADSRGFRGPELRELHYLVEANREAFIVSWDEHFGQ